MKCQDCGKEKEDVEETICPYAQDINEEIVNITVCEDCLDERAGDI